MLGEGATDLHKAVQTGEVSKVLAVLLAGSEADIGSEAEVIPPVGATQCCWTPLHLAAFHSRADIVAMLLDRGADPAARNGNGRTACQLAAGRLALTPVQSHLCGALETDAPPEQPSPSRAATATPDSTEGALRREFFIRGPLPALIMQGLSLHEIASYGGPEEVKQRLDQGADIHAKAEVYYIESDSLHPGATPLHIAAGFNPDPAVSALLLDGGADIEAKTEFGSTPLAWAAYSAPPEVAALLLDRGAAINAGNNSGATPLHSAAFNNTPAMAALLLDRGAIVEARTDRNETPLHWAARYNEPAMADLLLQRGARANSQDEQGETPCQLLRGNSKFNGASRLETVCRLLGTASTPTGVQVVTTPLAAATAPKPALPTPTSHRAWALNSNAPQDRQQMPLHAATLNENRWWPLCCWTGGRPQYDRQPGRYPL